MDSGSDVSGSIMMISSPEFGVDGDGSESESDSSDEEEERTMSGSLLVLVVVRGGVLERGRFIRRGVGGGRGSEEGFECNPTIFAYKPLTDSPVTRTLSGPSSLISSS